MNLRGNLNFLNRNDFSKPKKVVQGHQAALTALAVNQTTKTVYTADLTGRVVRWNEKNSNGEEIQGKGHSGHVMNLSVNSDGSKLLTTAVDDKLIVSDCKSDSFGNSSLALGAQVGGQAVSFKSPSRVYLGTKAQKVLVVDDGKVVGEAELPWKPSFVACSPQDDELAVAGGDKLLLFSVSGNSVKQSGKLEKHTVPITALAYSSDGRYIASSDSSCLIWIWNRKTGEIVNSGWKYHNSAVTFLEFSPDSTKCASCSLDGNIIVWKDLDSFNNKERVMIENAHWGGVVSVRWIDNSSFVSIGDDRTIKFWSLK
jgi:tricorn protease-like protein